MTSELEEVNQEIERLQEIIGRHETHMFTIRGWLLPVLGGLFAAYYTDNIDMSDAFMWIGVPVVVLLFLFVESRHMNVVEAAVERVTDLERLIARSRPTIRRGESGWYDGPKVTEACDVGAHRLLPRRGMTLVSNLPYYGVVLTISVVATLVLPAKQRNARVETASTAENEVRATFVFGGDDTRLTDARR